MGAIADRIERGLYRMAGGVARLGYPASWEKMGIDENQSVWASYMPGYVPTAPLKGETSADLAIFVSDRSHYLKWFWTRRSAWYHLKRGNIDQYSPFFTGLSLCFAPENGRNMAISRAD